MLGIATRMLTPADVDPDQIFRQHETEKNRQSSVRSIASHIHTISFQHDSWNGRECKRYHSRLAELVATKKGEKYATTMPWILAKVSFALLRSASLCLRGSRGSRRVKLDLSDADLDIQKGVANMH